MEVQEKIKEVDASFTWPHPTAKGYFVSASFVRTESDKLYLAYCPRTFGPKLMIDKNALDEYFHNYQFNFYSIGISLKQYLCMDGDNPSTYFIPLQPVFTKEIKKEEIEKLFGVKVVE